MLHIASNFDENYRGKINAVSMLKMMYRGFLPCADLAGYVSFLLENEMLVYRNIIDDIESQKKDFVF